MNIKLYKKEYVDDIISNKYIYIYIFIYIYIGVCVCVCMIYLLKVSGCYAFVQSDVYNINNNNKQGLIEGY